MRKVIVCTILLGSALGAAAELQNVDVGGQLVIRYRYWNNVYSHGINGPSQTRIPDFFVPGRSIGPFGVRGRYDFDERGPDLDFTEMRTRIHINADFTNEVSAFTEFESYDHWGTDFRSNYITGADSAGITTNDLEMYQGYIEANDLFGCPVRLRVGRQEIKLGKGWLVDNITTAIIGRSWDAIRLTYDENDLTVDAWWSKLAENSPIEQDGDVDFYGVYGTYKGLAHLNLSLYWMLVRDARSINDTNFVAPIEGLENLFGIDNYDPTNLNTIGMRAFGDYGPWDYDLELAYQTGNADAVGAGFRPYGLYGDDTADYDNLGGDVEVGYSLDMPWQPRLFVGGAYFQGEDNRDLSFADWINPFDKPKASVSFNRLFPGKPYSLVMEIGQDMSNFWQVRGGVVAHPTNKVTSLFRVAYFGVDEPFDWPRYLTLGRYRVPIAPSLSFWTQEASSDIGWTTFLVLKYDYSKDLYFRLAWEHLFPGDGLSQGSFLHRNGLEFSGGTDDDGADYLHLETGITF